MDNQENHQLTIVRATEAPKSSMRGVKDEARKIIEEGVPVEKLQQGFARFLDSIRAIVCIGRNQVGDFVLDEVTFSAEIGAEGEFKLLGTGIGVSASSGVTFTLRKPPVSK
jgi:hypothetical protein